MFILKFKFEYLKKNRKYFLRFYFKSIKSRMKITNLKSFILILLFECSCIFKHVTGQVANPIIPFVQKWLP